MNTKKRQAEKKARRLLYSGFDSVVGLVIDRTLALNDPMGLFNQNSQALLVSGVSGCIGYAVVSTREVL